MQQTQFLALYRGRTVSEARLIALTAEPEIVSRFAGVLSDDETNPISGEESTNNGQGEALCLVKRGEEQA